MGSVTWMVQAMESVGVGVWRRVPENSLDDGVEIGLPRPTPQSGCCELVQRVTCATRSVPHPTRHPALGAAPHSGVARDDRFRFLRRGRLSCTAVTEIPEHLLKRSKAAKAKADGAEAPADAPAAASSSAPATVAAATPAKPAAPAKPAGPPPPKPDIPVVAAAKSRKRIPFWAMATLSLLPLWTFMYVRGLTFKEAKVSGPLGEGAEVYTAACSSCHGGNGEGGVGYAFAGGEVLKTFPHIEDQLRFVYSGSVAYANAGIAVYGNPEREPLHNTLAKGQMPAQGSTQGGGLTEAQILAVVCHERYTLSGADPTAEYFEEYEKWCSPEAACVVGFEDGSLTFENIAETLEETFVVGTDAGRGSRSRRGALIAGSSGLQADAPADVLIVGGGPAGGAAAAWLAVTRSRRRRRRTAGVPRSKACGDVLTPRAVRQLQDLGLDRELSAWQRLDGVRLVHGERSLELPWPAHRDAPTHGLVVRRRDLDLTVLDHAAANGAVVRSGHEALGPIIERGFGEVPWCAPPAAPSSR